MEEKTVIEWLKCAKAQGHAWADLAILNASAEGDTLLRRVKTLESAVENGFYWRISAQGYDYWDNVYNSLLEQNL